MTPIGLLFLGVAAVLAVSCFRLLMGFGIHWVVCAALAILPLVATFFMGLIGLLISAVFTGALFKASAS